MKRPLAFFGFTLFGVLLCLNISGSTAFSAGLLIGASALFFISLIFKKFRQPLILPVVIGAVVSGCLLFICFQAQYNNISDFCGENVSVEGEVAESPYFSRENERYYCVIKVKSLSDERVSTKMRISFSESLDGIDHDDLQIGDRITFIATVYAMGTYNSTYKDYYKSQKIYLGAYGVESSEIIKAVRRPISYYIDALRDNITDNLLHDFDNNVASLLIAVLTGDKSFMDDSIYNDFKESGVVHIMAVSGLHLSIWVTFLAFFIDFEGRKGKIMAALMIVFTVFMMSFAHFTGSVRRAAVMTLLFFVGKILSKNADSLNSLGFAAICVLFVNPFAVSDISFMLSFLSTLGIIVMGIPLSEYIMKLFRYSRELMKKLIYPFIVCLAISISVSIFTMPVTVYYFGGISLAAPVTNMLFLFTGAPVILLTGLYSFLRFVPFVSALVALILKYLSLYMLKVAQYISFFRFSYLYADSNELRYCLMAVFVLAVLSLLLYRYRRGFAKVAAILSAGLLVLSIAVNTYTLYDRCKITLYGADSGNCAVASLGGRGVLIGFEGNSYSKNTLHSEVEARNIKIDAAIFPSEITDSGQRAVCHTLGTDNILTNSGASVTVFGKVTVTKTENTVTIDCNDTKTYIFYKDRLQDSDSYDIIKDSANLTCGDYENSFIFSVGESSPFTVLVRSESIEVRGESNWLNLTKKG